MLNRAPCVGTRYIGWGAIARDPAMPVRAGTFDSEVVVAARVAGSQFGCAQFASTPAVSSVGASVQVGAASFAAGVAVTAAGGSGNVTPSIASSAIGTAATAPGAMVVPATAIAAISTAAREAGAQLNTSRFAAAAAASVVGKGPGQTIVDPALFAPAYEVIDVPDDGFLVTIDADEFTVTVPAE